jgi:hypothetical protein
VETGYYTVRRLHTMADLRRTLPATGQADARNWGFLSTSGVHGSYATLDEIEAQIAERDTPPTITVLVLKPRTCTLLYGDIEISLADIPYLRELVRTTLHQVTLSQAGNT